jgi:hypothetical protein
MKTYNYLIGGSPNSYGSDNVEADTIEEAKQKILKEQLYLNVPLKADGEGIDALRIVEIVEVDEMGLRVENGEIETDIKIEGQPNCYDDGYEAGQKQTATQVSFMRALVSVSTRHLKPETVEQLNELDDMETVWTPSGFFISCHVPPPELEDAEELTDLITWAGERHRADFILIDRDGELHNELETFEWL